jgi:hypothetical protein
MDRRVALLLVGSLRNYSKTVASLKENLIDINKCDVFIITSFNNHSANIRSVEPKTTKESINEYTDTLCDCVKGIKIIEENMDECYHKAVKLYEHNFTGYNLKHINYPSEEFLKSIKSTYPVYVCWKMMEQYEIENKFKYDIVIRTRPDLLIKKPVIMEKVDNNTYYHNRPIEYKHYTEGTYCSDYLCYGHRGVMFRYAESVLTFGLTKKNIRNKVNINISLSKEYQLAFALLKCNIKLKGELASKKGEHNSQTHALVIIR